MDPPTTYISSSELRKHNLRNDAWISIHGKIYDVSSWLHRHPDSALPLLTVAGIDATNAFLAFHSPSAAAVLLPAFSTGLLLSDYVVSIASSDSEAPLQALRTQPLRTQGPHHPHLALPHPHPPPSLLSLRRSLALAPSCLPPRNPNPTTNRHPTGRDLTPPADAISDLVLFVDRLVRPVPVVEPLA
ncbi:Delta(8)-fatty-acid desaturase [Vigna angularis]|uniref:Delta(8)-fatty-acid desaturase n=1 Tax=Phaseolus angularis TaxID=3914 RepID=A0A8T0L9P4_PHAAN|nr:Delta(8)-fatty-acid desaturase [Vigna angularis]